MIGPRWKPSPCVYDGIPADMPPEAALHWEKQRGERKRREGGKKRGERKRRGEGKEEREKEKKRGRRKGEREKKEKRGKKR